MCSAAELVNISLIRNENIILFTFLNKYSVENIQ